MSVVPPEAPLRRGFFSRRSPAASEGAASSQLPAPALPERHGGTGYCVVGREPSVAFATWDLPHGVGEGWTVEFRCEGGAAAARTFCFAAQAHSAYLQGMIPGGRYAVRASLRSPEGAVRMLAPAVLELSLPPEAPGEGELRFARVPWAPGAAPAAPVPTVPAPLPSVGAVLPTSHGGRGPGAAATSATGAPAVSPGLPSSVGFRRPTSPGAR